MGAGCAEFCNDPFHWGLPFLQKDCESQHQRHSWLFTAWIWLGKSRNHAKAVCRRTFAQIAVESSDCSGESPGAGKTWTGRHSDSWEDKGMYDRRLGMNQSPQTAPTSLETNMVKRLTYMFLPVMAPFHLQVFTSLFWVVCQSCLVDCMLAKSSFLVWKPSSRALDGSRRSAMPQRRLASRPTWPFRQIGGARWIGHGVVLVSPIRRKKQQGTTCVGFVGEFVCDTLEANQRRGHSLQWKSSGHDLDR